LVNIGRGEVSDTLLMIMICHEMKWTYQEYESQPDWFIKAINQKINIEINHKNSEIKRAQSRAKVRR